MGIIRYDIFKATMKFKLYFLALFFFVTIAGYSQLSDFTLQVDPSNETCVNNGGIAITTSNTTAGATIKYSLYELPNTTTPIAQFSADSFTGLNSGDYRLVATQTLGESSNSDFFDFTINDGRIPLEFGVVLSTVTDCDQTVTLTVNVTSGLGPFFYEIIAGPVLFPLQLSNEFTGLVAGFYKIRVVDNCGNGEVLDYTLQLGTTGLAVLQVGDASSPAVATSCTNRDVTNLVTLLAGTAIVYPLTVQYVLHLPGGIDQIVNQSYPTGPSDQLELLLNVPLYPFEIYTYDVAVTNSCGVVFSNLGNIVDPNPSVTISPVPDECRNVYLIIAAQNFSPPYTLDFIEAPAGFDPALYNALDPGPFTNISVNYGSDTLFAPEGDYKVQLLDGCGRLSAVAEFTVEPKELKPIVSDSGVSCTGTGGIARIALPESRKIVSAFITIAPAAYTPALPQDVSSFLSDSGILTVTGLPMGKYTFTFTDECGNDYEEEVEIEAFDPAFEFILSVLPGCTPEIASIRLRSPNSGALTSVIVESAPAGFMHPLPYDATAEVIGGTLFMTDMPSGDYSFSGTDSCGLTLTISRNVKGYDPGTSNYYFVPHCGSFDLKVTDHSSIIGVSYWLQKLDPLTNTWGHPATNVQYTEGTTPTTANSISVSNQITTFNLTYTGTFRIVKVYQTYDQGSAFCYDKYPPFVFSGNLEILNTYSLECEGGSGPSGVYIDVSGVPPYVLRILTKDGAPFPVNNGDNTTFDNLAAGLYVIQVEDSCFRTRTVNVNVGTLLPLVQATDPASVGKGELLICSETGASTGVFDLTSLSPVILGNQAADNYIITYHTSQADADSGDHFIVLPQSYSNTSNPQTIYVRVVHSSIGICYDTTSFELYVGKAPVLSVATDQYLCDEGTIRIFADSDYDSYKWSTGALTSYIDVDEPGIYSVEVSNMYGASKCSTTKDITVLGSGPPTITDVEVNDWNGRENSIAINVTGSGDYVYSLDGENYQNSNVFTGLLPGIYMVYVKDIHGCGIISREAIVFDYPKFFTPNGDGFNDKWQIKNSILEPEMQIYIYDRYGKLITGFKAGSPGWDGTYNGHPLPSTDYWFVVERADGTVHRGHFAMKR